MTTSPQRTPAKEASPAPALDGKGLAFAIAILLGSLTATAGVFWISAKLPESRVSVLFALGIVATGMTIALVVGWIGAGRQNAVAATLIGSGVRFGLPILAMMMAKNEKAFEGWFRVQESGFLTQILVLYFVGLLVETALVYRRAFQLTNWKVKGPKTPSEQADEASSHHLAATQN
jgi:hypothetical protein